VQLFAAVKNVYIVAAKRTPFGTYGGKLMKFSATELQAHATRAAIQSINLSPELINSVIVGNVFQVSFNSFFKLRTLG
jgi:acetyl-CoA acyltransferase 2